ncbi:MAG: cysteine desulfurase [Clostridiales bacterium]|nr:cysteine desulfurase [Clostridiales bacterium]
MQVYLDNSATTRPHKEVIDAMIGCYETHYGNASSLHRMGIQAEKMIKDARNSVGQSLNVSDSEIIFTSGGTESNNTAIFGAAEALKRTGNRIITSAIEHPAVLNVCKSLEQNGMDVKYLNVNDKGLIQLDALEEYFNEKTILISVMHVNNELGTIQPIEEIAKYKKSCSKFYFHVDAVQSYGKMKISPKTIGIDLLSVSGHKLHGPKGIGALFIDKSIHIPPLLYGGLQEYGIRSGTENVPGIIGLGQAAAMAYNNLETDINNIKHVRSYLIQGIKEEIKDIRINSYEDDRCIPHILNISFMGIRGEVLLHMLEQAEIYVSTGSACSSKKKGLSHVLKAAGLSNSEIEGAVRFSFSKYNSIEEMDYVLDHLKKGINSIRKIMRK